MAWMRSGDSRGPDLLTHSLAAWLARRLPAFALADVSFSTWETSIDRGIGMLLRPPSRILVDAGLDRQDAHKFPIRLDPNAGTMAGSWMPAHLVPKFEELLESRLARHVKRLQESEVEPVLTIATLLEAVKWARSQETGLLEAMDVVHEGMDAYGVVYFANRKAVDSGLRKRLEEAAKPPKRPGLVARMLGRKDESADEDAAMQAWLDADTR
ncbi:MAG: hypothetical protein M3Y37_11705 [Chloroflexota bacterium]|nr:hypothetical protein [Chloroflexota bacterium]